MTSDQTTSNTTDAPWWNSHRRHYPKPLVAYFEAEAYATTVRSFQPFVIPALLQEPGYAEALLRSYSNTSTAEMIDRTIAVRATRRAAFLGGQQEAAFVLDASALRRPVGSDEVMKKQHAWLRELASSGRASIKVMDGAYSGMKTHFTLFTVAGETVAFVDKEKGAEQVDGARRDKLIELFDVFQQQATPLHDCSLLTVAE